MKKEGRASKLDVYEGVRDEVTQRENEAPGRRKKRQRRVVCRVLLPRPVDRTGRGPAGEHRAASGRWSRLVRGGDLRVYESVACFGFCACAVGVSDKVVYTL